MAMTVKVLRGRLNINKPFSVYRALNQTVQGRALSGLFSIEIKTQAKFNLSLP